jgi:hypothetical protein
MAVALAFGALGAGVIAEVMKAPKADAGYFDLQSATFFPLSTALIILAASAFLALRALTGSQPAQAPAPDKPRHFRAVMATVVLVVYAWLMFRIGFWPSSSLAIIAMGLLLTAQAFSRRRLLWLGAIGLTVPGLVMITFDWFLAVKMPVGGGF